MRAHHVRDQEWRDGSPFWMITRGNRDQTLCQKNGRRQLETFIVVTITHHRIRRTLLSALIQFIVRKPKPSQEYTTTNRGINSGESSKNRIKELQTRYAIPRLRWNVPLYFVSMHHGKWSRGNIPLVYAWTAKSWTHVDVVQKHP